MDEGVLKCKGVMMMMPLQKSEREKKTGEGRRKRGSGNPHLSVKTNRIALVAPLLEWPLCVAVRVCTLWSKTIDCSFVARLYYPQQHLLAACVRRKMEGDRTFPGALFFTVSITHFLSSTIDGSTQRGPLFLYFSFSLFMSSVGLPDSKIEKAGRLHERTLSDVTYLNFHNRWRTVLTNNTRRNNE